MALSSTPRFTPWLAEHDACGVGFIYRPSASHQVIKEALGALTCMEHRGGCGADRDSGDGAGVLTAIPWDILEVSDPSGMAVGMFFLPQGDASACRSLVEQVCEREGLRVLRWRVVPTRPEV